ncbi:hypothetical protein FACS189496_3220 [Bacilli bacterium]|nr:hypothetical protein FACS189496_3220 [Bacilli bacterium]
MHEKKRMIKKITELGANHDWYVKKETNVGQAIPRHNEIKETTAWRIGSRLSGNGGR